MAQIGLQNSLFIDITESILLENSSSAIASYFKYWSNPQLNTKLSNKRYCLELALEANNLAAIRYFADRNINFDVKFDDNKTPLNLAAKCHQKIKEIVEECTSKHSLSKSKQDSLEYSSLKSQRHASAQPPTLATKPQARKSGIVLRSKLPTKKGKTMMSSKEFEDEVQALLERFQGQTQNKEKQSETYSSHLLKKAQRLANRKPADSMVNTAQWRLPILVFRGPDSLLGLMMLRRTCQDPPTSLLVDAIESGNEFAFFYLAAVTGLYPLRGYERGKLQYLRDAGAALEEGRSSQRQEFLFPKRFITAWRELFDINSYAPELQTLEMIEQNDCVQLSGHDTGDENSEGEYTSDEEEIGSQENSVKNGDEGESSSNSSGSESDSE
jgi:hypothetical protein